MKKNSIVLVLGLMFLWSCKKEAATEEFKIEKPANPFSETCYQGVEGKDTISMTLICKGNQLQYGKLAYNHYEKDDNDGTLVGAFHGDTLVGKYSFQSEGVTSVREVIFLKRGNDYIEGFGPVVDDHQGKVTFKDIKTVTFTGSPLVVIPCVD